MELTIRINKQTLVGFLVGVVISSGIWTPIYFLKNKSASTADNALNNKQVAENNNNAQNNQPSAPTKVNFQITDSDHIRGNKNAKIVLVEFSDFQCPFCARHHQTMKKLIEKYKDQVVWVWKHFPLTSIHPYALKAALASECAGEQNKFWEYGDKLFENQSQFNDQIFEKIAQDLKLDVSKFNACFQSNKYLSKVQSDLAEGANAGVEGTPTTYVNGEAISGAIPFENFDAFLQQQIK